MDFVLAWRLWRDQPLSWMQGLLTCEVRPRLCLLRRLGLRSSRQHKMLPSFHNLVSLRSSHPSSPAQDILEKPSLHCGVRLAAHSNGVTDRQKLFQPVIGEIERRAWHRSYASIVSSSLFAFTVRSFLPSGCDEKRAGSCQQA